MKYTFDNTSKKFICPNCNKKRFVRFIDLETNLYLDPIFGKCDRETNCGYFKKPCKTLAINNASTVQHNFIAQKESKIDTFHTIEQLQVSLQRYCNNNFYLFLTSIFDKESVQQTFNDYKIGTSKTWNGATIFWQIDNRNNIRAGKILLLDKLTCKRVKEPYPHITWVHSKLKLDNFNLKQCLFGLHLASNNNKIAITESEKTTVIMNLFMPEYRWLSTGSKQNFKYEILLPIKDKEIVAFPDKSEYEYWSSKANELNQLGFKIKVSDYLEKIDCETGTDLADIYLGLQQPSKTFIELTKDEEQIVNLSKKNSDILNLIE
ncbi:DUF6371 domain-containing protein, partial [Flavobacterium sp.]|uniref:DUF6371 domain-containing protein n=1 Tax=Flavobacterium sp. TaxID=239 RepID=UPI000EDCD3DA